MRCIPSILAVILTISAPAASAQDAAPAEARRVCEAKADQAGITGDNRATYLRECEAGERLVRGEAPR